MRFATPFMLVALLLAVSSAPAHGDEPVARTVDSLLSLMTLEEKIGQLTQYTARLDTASGNRVMLPAQAEQVRRGQVGSILNMTGAAVTREAQRVAVEESRLKIPLLFGLDVVHGYRTIFPIPLAEASSWDPTAVERAARVAAVEASSAGIHWTFAPMVDIARDPRWGRIAEGSGEDTYLGAVMAAARVRGFQGTGPGSPSALLACPKHFAAYGGAEGGRDYNTVDVSERTLREVYLPPFEAAVRAGAGTVMCSFNEIAGVPSSGNRRLLTDILRGEWGFDGFVVSDWNSIGELVNHGVAATAAEAGSLALKAGVDMDMESNCYRDGVTQLASEGKFDVAVIDEAVRRVLRAKVRMGLFTDPYRFSDPAREGREILAAEKRADARDMARRSIVLLKNEGDVLPISKKTASVAVIGPLADSRREELGTWSALGKPEDIVSVLQGIREALPGARVLYEQGCPIDSGTTAGFAAAVAAARQAEVAVLVLGEAAWMSGEAASRSSLDLPGHQQKLLEAVSATGKPVVLVLMNGRPLALSWAAEHINAIVETWFLGVECGHAVGDVLFGDYNPGGKLPVSFPRSVGQLPVYYNHKNTGRPGDDTTKYTSKYLDLPLTPLYPFGYGLSYTRFAYEDLRLSSGRIGPNDTLLVTVTVRNAGSRRGDEVVQLYLKDEVGSVTRPVRELKGFRRITLDPGQATTVTFSLGGDLLAMYDSSMKRVVEPGRFRVFVGTNSQAALEGSFEVIDAR